MLGVLFLSISYVACLGQLLGPRRCRLSLVQLPVLDHVQPMLYSLQFTLLPTCIKLTTYYFPSHYTFVNFSLWVCVWVVFCLAKQL
jgi:hypothetical protein